MGGLLGEIFSWADGVKRRVSNPLQTVGLGLIRGTEDLAAAAQDMDVGYGRNGMNSVLVSPQQRAQAQQRAADFGANMGLGAATVWHGSPHKFDKFDSSKIGTGEGAQAYGHGIYTAESPDVARSYVQSVVANSDELAKRGTSHGLPADVASNLIAAKQSGKNFDAMIDAAKKAAENPLIPQSQKMAAQRLVDNEMQAYNAWSDWSKPGNLYKVDLPDNAIARMLDWDKPLQEQAGLLEQLGAKLDQTRLGNELGVYKGKLPTAALGGSASYGSKSQPATGADLYRRIAGSQWAKENPAQASEMLRGAGVPGIRYLDGGSRGAGQGSSNFVVFPGQENLLSILERNGVPIK